MSSLLQVPFGLRLPGTDGFSLPQEAVPGGPMPAPLPDGMGQESGAFGFQPPPAMPPPPSEPDQLQGHSAQAPMENLPTTPSGGLAPTPQVGSSDQKWGLKQWLPLILGTVGAGVWAGKNKSLTDFGTNLLQGAAKQTFDQLEEKRKRQFDLDTANLKQGQEAIKDLIAINDNDLVALQKEVESNPQFAHMAAYIQPLREAKQKYSDFASPSSDGGTKITAKEAAELSHYYNAIKGAKEAINRFHTQTEQVGFAGKLEAAKDDAKYQSLIEAYKAAGGKNPDLLFKVYGGREGVKGLTQQQFNNDQRIAAWYAKQHNLPGWEAVLGDPATMQEAINSLKTTTTGEGAAARAANMPPSFAFQFVSPPGESPFLAGANRRNPADVRRVELPGGATQFKPLDTQEANAISGMHLVAQAYSNLNDIIAKHPDLFSPQGKFANWDLDKLGGYLTQATGALTPEEASLAAELKNANITKMFAEGGKNLTGTEQALVGGLLVQPGDSILKAIGNSKAFIKQYGRYLANKQATHPQTDPTIYNPRVAAPLDDTEETVFASFVKKKGRQPTMQEMQLLRQAIKARTGGK